MRIIYLDSGRIPTEKAHGIQIMKMCEALAELGHQVTLVTGSRRNYIKTDPFLYYGIKKRFEFKRLPSLDLVNIWPKFGTWLTRFSFILCAKFYLLFHKYDLVYFREHMSGLFFRDFILETHTLPEKIRAADLRVWERARLIVVTTNYIRERLVVAGMDSNKIIVVPDGVDLARFKIYDLRFKNKYREEIGLPQDDKIIMYTGHLYEWKGAESLLYTAKQFTLIWPPATLSPRGRGVGGEGVKFVFVGGTEEDIKKFREQVRGLENVLILGHKPYDEIPKYLAAADVLVLPNSGKTDISRYYTSPLKLFDYMASGRPIVASDLPSIREILDEKNSVLVTPDNPEALATGITKLLTDADLAERISRTAADQVREYVWGRRAERILAMLNRQIV